MRKTCGCRGCLELLSLPVVCEEKSRKLITDDEGYVLQELGKSDAPFSIPEWDRRFFFKVTKNFEINEHNNNITKREEEEAISQQWDCDDDETTCLNCEGGRQKFPECNISATCPA